MTPRACPFDGVALDAAGDCRRCGTGWRTEDDVRARGATAFGRLALDDGRSVGPSRSLSCSVCRAPLAPWRLGKLDIWLYRCAACAGWTCPRGTLATLARVDDQLQRQAAFESFSPDERAQMAREIAAETAESMAEPELPFIHRLLALMGVPVVTRIRRERLPLVTWALAAALVVVFVIERRGGGVDAAVARLGFGPEHRGVWPALTATFVHAGWLHLLGNVYFLLAFGDGVEQRAPRWLLAVAFVVLGAGVLALDGALHPSDVLVGASGGVAAMIGACVVFQPRAQVTIQLGPLVLRVSMRGFFLLALAFQGLMGVLHVPGVAWTAHLLGLAFGATGAALLRLHGERRVSVRS
jgi:membrane associated rhomboid family serine protease